MTKTPTVDLARTKIRVIKPNLKTGEIIEQVIPVKDFRPKLPSKPKVDERRITLVTRDDATGPTGLSVIYMLGHREAEIAYYEAHDHILTREERRHLLKADSTSILRPIAPAWKVGDRMYLASDMEVEVTEVTESPRGHGTVFRVHDYRMRYLRRGVIGSDTPKTDEHGYAPEPTDPEKRKAAIDSAYTTVSAQAIDEAGAVMDEAAFERIHAERSAGNALRQSKGRVQVTKGRLLRRIAEARAKHRTSTVRHLERQLARLVEKEQKAVA